MPSAAARAFRVTDALLLPTASVAASGIAAGLIVLAPQQGEGRMGGARTAGAGSDNRACPQYRRPRFHPWVRKIPWKRAWQPTPVSWPRESHVQRSLVAAVHGVAQSQTGLSDKG